MKRLPIALALIMASAAPALAQDVEPNVEFFYPLVTRRPVIERELELRIAHEKTDDARETTIAGAIEWPVLPRWQIELEVPIVVRAPREESSQTGLADIEIQNKVLLFQSVEHRALVAAGFDLRLPTGSETRELGGEFAIEPFAVAGIGFGAFEVLADIAWERNLNAHVEGAHEQELSGDIAVGWLAHPRFTPLVEINTITRLTGGDEEETRLRDRTQVYVTPGFNVRLGPGMTGRVGIQLPVTSAHEIDYAVHAGVVFEF